MAGCYVFAGSRCVCISVTTLECGVNPEGIMKPKRIFLSSFLLTLALFSSVSTLAIDRDEYVASVMEIFRTHVQILQELSGPHQFKYSDNVVRHAIAIERTFGFLGPMEWHAAQSAKLHGLRNGTDEELNEDMFERLARASRKSIRELVRTAHDSMDEYDQEGLLKALEDMKQSCENCHSLLPKAVAPDLWGPLERQ